jgi:hypothetical protein
MPREKEAQLAALAQRRNLRVPPAEYRVDRRGLWQFFEVRERWEGQDPKCYSEVVAWFRAWVVPGRGRCRQLGGLGGGRVADFRVAITRYSAAFSQWS